MGAGHTRLSKSRAQIGPIGAESECDLRIGLFSYFDNTLASLYCGEVISRQATNRPCSKYASTMIRNRADGLAGSASMSERDVI